MTNDDDRVSVMFKEVGGQRHVFMSGYYKREGLVLGGRYNGEAINGDKRATFILIKIGDSETLLR